MLSPTDVLVHSLSSSQKLLNRYCEDLTPAEYLHRPCGGSNCVAWLIGHLVISERSALGRVGMTDLPPLPEGFEKRFARDAEAPKAEAFGDVSILLPLFNQHRYAEAWWLIALCPALGVSLWLILSRDRGLV